MSENEPASSPDHDPIADRARSLARALRKHRQRVERKLEAIRGDWAEAEAAADHRRAGEALLAYLHRVPRRAASVTLPDPADPDRSLEIELDPALTPQANAARYFKRAAKAERARQEVPARLRAAEREAAGANDMLRRLDTLVADADASVAARERRLARLIEAAREALPPVLRRELPPPGAARPPGKGAERGDATVRPNPARRAERPLPAKLAPRRLKTSEGWDVLIGRNNEGNDHLTHALARPEDYWFHVHGCPGSHVVLRRGKGKNEPSKRTLGEVAAWAAFYSQARTAGKVPVIWTLKKYVRRPRKSPAGLAVCEREKMIMVRPVEPPRSALADEAP
jgi:predicted ribosome quality control (RQC) complex YloA/Tae2 family protein